ncbi:MAG: iron ABC transporter permease [Chitinophagales bacterium]|nr:iron ABC transporter permease [Chitinophagales bacterium]
MKPLVRNSCFLLLINLALFLLSLKWGYESMTWAEVFHIDTENVILHLRLMSALTASIAGAGLALAGLLLQNLFRNPLAGPSILGITSFSSLTIAIILLGSQYLGIRMTSYLSMSYDFIILLGSAIGAFLCLAILFFFNNKNKVLSHLLIVGMMIAGFCGGLIQLADILLSKDNLQSITLWNLGSFKDCDYVQLGILFVIVLVSSILVFVKYNQYNIYQLGDEYARGLGVDIHALRRTTIIVTALLSSSITAFCGPIGFIGLAIPHIAFFMVKSHNFKYLIPYTILLGIAFSLICNIISNVSIFEISLPINAITSLLGAPFVIYLLRRLHYV